MVTLTSRGVGRRRGGGVFTLRRVTPRLARHAGGMQKQRGPENPNSYTCTHVSPTYRRDDREPDDAGLHPRVVVSRGGGVRGAGSVPRLPPPTGRPLGDSGAATKRWPPTSCADARRATRPA